MTPAGAAAPGERAAGTPPRDQPVLDHPHRDLRDVEHLPPDHPGRPLLFRQVRAAAGAGARLVDDHLMGDGDLPQRAAGPTRLPARLTPGPAPPGPPGR